MIRVFFGPSAKPELHYNKYSKQQLADMNQAFGEATRHIREAQPSLPTFSKPSQEAYDLMLAWRAGL
ncbi:hypothetical protein AWB71_05287 [Caballeronia peredens]|nr:hypothetical protein AWB71_05287 [Caballeronia peredens]